MKCGIIVPTFAIDAIASSTRATAMSLAIKNSKGPFSSIEEIPINIADGSLSNTAGKVLGIGRAHAANCDWIFFLDESDLLFVDVFKNMAHLEPHYDVIWGIGCEASDPNLSDVKLVPERSKGTQQVRERNGSTANFFPETGFFIRTKFALELLAENSAETEVKVFSKREITTNLKFFCSQFIFYIKVLNSKTLNPSDDRIGLPRSNLIVGAHSSSIKRIELESDEIQKNDQTLLFTIGTLVSDLETYEELIGSFVEKGFTQTNCEFLYVDNSQKTKMDTYRGLTSILNSAKAKFVILCRQCVRLLDDDINVLLARLSYLDQLDTNWALAGSAGGAAAGVRVSKKCDLHGANRPNDSFPHRVFSLDDAFLILKRKNRISFSHDLSSSYFYGTDICLIADMLGYSAYVIDFNLEQISCDSHLDTDIKAKKEFEMKWGYALRARTLQTTYTIVDVEPVPSMESIAYYKTQKNLIYQIYYDLQSQAKVSQHFIPLDNSASLHPDWFEFSIIRDSLRNFDLEDDCFYGFLSPRFEEKTGYSAEETIRMIKSTPAGTDVVLLTHGTHDLVRFKNIFLQGDRFHPGLIDVSEAFFRYIGQPINLRRLVNTLDQSVFSNYIIAKPCFWRKWLSLADQFFEYAENKDNHYWAILNKGVSYKGTLDVQMKVFVQERLASYLLTISPFNVFIPSYFGKHKMLDNEWRATITYMENLKRAYVDTNETRFLSEYDNIAAIIDRALGSPC